MLDFLKEIVSHHVKAFGILGDSLTFFGGMLLALEALWKKTERTAIATKKTTASYFPEAQDQQGKPINPDDEEQKWFSRWNFASKAGTVIMAVGFLFLLVTRIFAE